MAAACFNSCAVLLIKSVPASTASGDLGAEEDDNSFDSSLQHCDEANVVHSAAVRHIHLTRRRRVSCHVHVCIRVCTSVYVCVCVPVGDQYSALGFSSLNIHSSERCVPSSSPNSPGMRALYPSSLVSAPYPSSLVSAPYPSSLVS